jgi:flagellar biosynthesis protein FlhF
VLRHGARKLALVTTDGYRIGAHEQLRIYGRILGVPVHLARDAKDLRATLRDLQHTHMVLIDTMGMSQRDRMVERTGGHVRRQRRQVALLLCRRPAAAIRSMTSSAPTAAGSGGLYSDQGR